MPVELIPHRSKQVRSGYLDVNPRYADRFESLGLCRAAGLVDWPGLIVGGHPDRHVRKVTIDEQVMYLKCEHRIPWGWRLRCAREGYGLSSLSWREAQTLRVIKSRAPAGIVVPEVVAVGADGQGRAFLLLRAVEGMIELRRFLDGANDTGLRGRMARRLGKALAALHGAGISHRDLYSKHVLIDATATRFAILDWQRATVGRVRWPERIRDLATLDATIADSLATTRERLACLTAYRSASGDGSPSLAQLCHRIRAETQSLNRRRSIREQRHPPLADDAQLLVMLEGEELVVTMAGQQEFTRQTLMQLAYAAMQPGVITKTVPWNGGELDLTRRRVIQPWRRWWTRLRAKWWAAPEVLAAGKMLRLQRCGEVVPELLAFGHRLLPGGVTDSFLLTRARSEGKR